MNAATVTFLRRAGPRTLLIVEDEVLVRCLVSDALRAEGYNVLEAASGEEAIAVLKTAPVHLVFADLRIPGSTDGLAVARFAHSLHPRPKIILTSGKARAPDIPDLDELGSFVAKPYLISRVVELVTRTLGPNGGTEP